MLTSRVHPARPCVLFLLGLAFLSTHLSIFCNPLWPKMRSSGWRPIKIKRFNLIKYLGYPTVRTLHDSCAVGSQSRLRSVAKVMGGANSRSRSDLMERELRRAKQEHCLHVDMTIAPGQERAVNMLGSTLFLCQQRREFPDGLIYYHFLITDNKTLIEFDERGMKIGEQVGDRQFHKLQKIPKTPEVCCVAGKA